MRKQSKIVYGEAERKMIDVTRKQILRKELSFYNRYRNEKEWPYNKRIWRWRSAEAHDLLWEEVEDERMNGILYGHDAHGGMELYRKHHGMRKIHSLIGVNSIRRRWGDG